MTVTMIIDAARTPRGTPPRLWSFAVDAPVARSIATNDTIQVDGWIIGRDEPVLAVEARVGDQVLARIPLSVPRDDVAAANPDAPDVEFRGFRGEIPAANLPSTFGVYLWAMFADDGGTHFAILEGRRGEDVEPLESTSGEDSPGEWPEVSIDSPHPNAKLAPGSIINGWAYSPDGIEEISVWLDGELLGHATHGSVRFDVSDAFPNWTDATHSGFWYGVTALPAEALERGAGALTVTAEDTLGRRRSINCPVKLIPHPPIAPAGAIDIPKLHEPHDPLREAGWSSPLVAYGWAIDPKGVDRIDVLLDGKVAGEAQLGLAREDIQYHNRLYRQLDLPRQAGWVAILPTEEYDPGQHTLGAVVHGLSGTFNLNEKPVWLRNESARADPTRQARLEGLLRCPGCGGPVRRQGAELRCSTCERTIPTNEFGTLLFEETYAGLDWREAGATSHGYPAEAAAIITGIEDGLVLDVGAGLRENLPHVIQLDAIPFPTADISASAEAMPFADESFDAVIACNLMEHVSSPTEVIKELRRVCKIGGQLYVDWTSVHPYHGFPHHYFNATETGLDWLMHNVGGASGETVGVEPQVAVWQVLNGWLGSLDDPGARLFVEGMTVGEFVYLISSPDMDPERYQLLGNVFPGGRRLVPAKVTFTGKRER